MRSAPIIVAMALVMATSGDSQTSSAVVIEVASIKLSDPATCREYPIIDDHNDRYDLRCVKTSFLIQTAYNVRDFQISGGPAWLSSAQYDIAAKIASSPSDTPEKNISELTDQERQTKGERLRAVLQALLAERFRLKVHRESKQLPLYVLTLAKGGPKLKASNDSNASGGLRPGRGFLVGNQTGVPFLAQTLSQIVGRPIQDRTELAGKYDFELTWNPDQSSANSAVGGRARALPVGNADLPNIFTALQEQLGLKLDSTKGPAEVIVIDRVDRPSAN